MAVEQIQVTEIEVEQIEVAQVAVEQIRATESFEYGPLFDVFNVVDEEPAVLNEGDFYIILNN